MEEKMTNEAEKQPSQPKQHNKRPNGKRRFNFYWIYAILAALLIGLQFYGRDAATPTEEINQGKLIELLKTQEISKIQLVTSEIQYFRLTLSM